MAFCAPSAAEGRDRPVRVANPFELTSQAQTLLEDVVGSSGFRRVIGKVEIVSKPLIVFLQLKKLCNHDVVETAAWRRTAKRGDFALTVSDAFETAVFDDGPSG
jgi:hypothetical protein